MRYYADIVYSFWFSFHVLIPTTMNLFISTCSKVVQKLAFRSNRRSHCWRIMV